MDGRWPVTSGFKFKFDPSKEPGDRVVDGSLEKTETSEQIDMNKEYFLTTSHYLFTGKDGYSAFLDPSIKLLSEDLDAAPMLD